MCHAKHAPLETGGPVTGICSPPSCADGCLAGDMYLNIFTSWSVPAHIVYCQNYMICKYSHGLVAKFGDGNHSNLGSIPDNEQRNFVE